MSDILYKPRVYFASAFDRHGVGRMLSEDPQWAFVHWTSTWITKTYLEAVSTPEEFADHWTLDFKEIRDSDILMLYGREAMPRLKGALVECGVAIASGLKVLAIGLDVSVHTWAHHPAVHRVNTLAQARNHLYSFTISARPRRPEEKKPNAKTNETDN
jgi:hypothetical protein